MEDPTPMSVEIFDGMFMTRQSTNDTMSDVAMVETMMGREVAPTRAICPRLRPNPKRMTAYCKIFFEVNLTPGCSGAVAFAGTASASTMPMRIANTGPPTTSKRLPSSHAGTAMARHMSTPFQSER